MDDNAPDALSRAVPEKWARCNFDGKPIHPDDMAIMVRFREWLALPEEERRAPEWHEFLGIKTEGAEDNDGHSL